MDQKCIESLHQMLSKAVFTLELDLMKYSKETTERAEPDGNINDSHSRDHLLKNLASVKAGLDALGTFENQGINGMKTADSAALLSILLCSSTVAWDVQQRHDSQRQPVLFPDPELPPTDDPGKDPGSPMPRNPDPKTPKPK